MYSIKKNILQVVALLKAHNIKQVVLSPGSRNAPLIHCFSQDKFFNCHVVVDERNAGFYAIGVIQATNEPTVICCTSGTALLNYGPAVAEAYYQKLPLIVLSADRTSEWIGQMDGQTIPQANVFQSITSLSVNLPEIKSEQDEWLCNRLTNEAILKSVYPENSPVHINIPISEPLFDYSEKDLPIVREIDIPKSHIIVDLPHFIDKWKNSKKRLIIVGQHVKDKELNLILEKIATDKNCIVFTEHLSNCFSEQSINNFDTILYHLLNSDKKEEFAPDLIITLGGHIVSKRLKQFIRQNPPKEHWHISPSAEIIDLYQCLTEVIPSDAKTFLSDFGQQIKDEKNNYYTNRWHNLVDKVKEPQSNADYSDIYAIGALLKQLPNHSFLHLGNSSSLRNAQLYNLPESTKVYCNRGTNGIESSLPSAIGFAASVKEQTYLIIGDISFFYTVGALWNIEKINNLRILLINNNGGGIFYLLPGLDTASSLRKHVATEHNTSAEKWAEAAKLQYIKARNKTELDKALEIFTSEKINNNIILEIFADIEAGKQVINKYYTDNQFKI